jgi:molybdopterin synthase sulfur carrier subunit
MRISIRLFGAFRQFQDSDLLELEMPDAQRPDAATVADVRLALDAYALAHWRGYDVGLLRSSAFATEETVLRANSPIPADGRLAVIPPVSGG